MYFVLCSKFYPHDCSIMLYFESHLYKCMSCTQCHHWVAALYTFSDSTDGDGGGDELRHARLKRLHALRREAAELERLLGVTTSPNQVYSLDFKVMISYASTTLYGFEALQYHWELLGCTMPLMKLSFSFNGHM